MKQGPIVSLGILAILLIILGEMLTAVDSSYTVKIRENLWYLLLLWGCYNFFRGGLTQLAYDARCKFEDLSQLSDTEKRRHKERYFAQTKVFAILMFIVGTAAFLLNIFDFL